MLIPGVFEPTAAETECLLQILRNESGYDWGILCGGTRFHDFSAFPTWAGFKGSHAAGGYQFEPATWALVVQNNPMITDFSPLAQDIGALWLLRKYGPNSTESWAASGPYPFALQNGVLVQT